MRALFSVQQHFIVLFFVLFSPFLIHTPAHKLAIHAHISRRAWCACRTLTFQAHCLCQRLPLSTERQPSHVCVYVLWYVNGWIKEQKEQQQWKLEKLISRPVGKHTIATTITERVDGNRKNAGRWEVGEKRERASEKKEIKCTLCGSWILLFCEKFPPPFFLASYMPCMWAREEEGEASKLFLCSTFSYSSALFGRSWAWKRDAGKQFKLRQQQSSPFSFFMLFSLCILFVVALCELP